MSRRYRKAGNEIEGVSNGFIGRRVMGTGVEGEFGLKEKKDWRGMEAGGMQAGAN